MSRITVNSTPKSFKGLIIVFGVFVFFFRFTIGCGRILKGEKTEFLPYKNEKTQFFHYMIFIFYPYIILPASKL